MTEITGTPETRSLYATNHEHHERIMAHVDMLPKLAEMVDTADWATFSASFVSECQFINMNLVPHIEAIEGILYGELDRLMDGRHSMVPMREEHERLRLLLASMCRYRQAIERGSFEPEERMGLRRVLFRLYSLLKVHLVEEEMYLRVVERDLSPEEVDRLARGIDQSASQPI